MLVYCVGRGLYVQTVFAFFEIKKKTFMLKLILYNLLILRALRFIAPSTGLACLVQLFSCVLSFDKSNKVFLFSYYFYVFDDGEGNRNAAKREETFPVLVMLK